MPSKRRTISFVLYPEFQLLDAAGPIAAFEVASRFVPEAYALRMTASCAGRVRSSSGISLDVERIGRLAGVDTVIAVGGFGCRKALDDALLMRFLRRADAAVPRMASVCSGAMLLAEAGLLDGKRVTTHWGRVQEMRQRYPTLQVESDRLWISIGTRYSRTGSDRATTNDLRCLTRTISSDTAPSRGRISRTPSLPKDNCTTFCASGGRGSTGLRATGCAQRAPNSTPSKVICFTSPVANH